MKVIAKITCPVCGGEDVNRLFHLGDCPILCNHLPSSAEEAKRGSRGEIELVQCRQCTHMYNIRFDPEKIVYAADYNASLISSPRYRRYAQGQAERLVNDYGLEGKTVVDIGCGDGSFLALFAERGRCKTIGYEPAAANRDEPGPSGVKIVPHGFEPDDQRGTVSCFLSRHVLEHLSNPGDLLEQIRRDMNGEAVIYAEVPSGEFMLRSVSIWDVIYEHYSYFTPLSLGYLFDRCGCISKRLVQVFGDQYLSLDAVKMGAAGSLPAVDQGPARELLLELGKRFALARQKKIEETGKLIEDSASSGKKGVLWGAGSKGVSILNQLGGRGHIEYVVDISSKKQGRYIPGTGQPIVPPEHLKTVKPDVVYITNTLYAEEVRGILMTLGLRPVIESLQ